MEASPLARVQPGDREEDQARAHALKKDLCGPLPSRLEQDPVRAFPVFLEYMARLVEETPHVPKPEGFDQFLDYMRTLIAGAPNPVGDELLKEEKTVDCLRARSEFIVDPGGQASE